MQNGSRIDLTAGPIFKTLMRLALPVTISMVMFTVYLILDLIFVGRLGPEAVAALSISSNAFFIHFIFVHDFALYGRQLFPGHGRHQNTHDHPAADQFAHHRSGHRRIGNGGNRFGRDRVSDTSGNLHTGHRAGIRHGRN
jgi:hypothetical protein